MAVWPPGLPARPLAEGFSEQPVSSVVRTEVDYGPAKLRRRYTGDIRNYTMNFLVTQAQVAILEAFYYSTLGCVDPFDWVDHRTGAASVYRFRAPPSYSEAGAPHLWRTTLELESVP